MLYNAFFISGDDKKSVCLFVYKVFAKLLILS